MTDGEIIFHLREICADWTTPRITSATAAELERQKLIEYSEDRLAVRLTPDGVRRKIAGRASAAAPRTPPVRGRQQRQRTSRRFATIPRRLV